ncbi:MAG: hypothetical protein FJX51_12200, partial [Alphaproteobacteria bacterium]|nr:hypothetical protein [Alphaproteobacteria bacterium]
ALMLAVHADQMQAYPNTARQFLREGVYAYRPAVLGPADLHKQPALADTLEAISRHGPDAFYKGPIAASIAKAVREAGGILSEADLAGYRARAAAPGRILYRGHRIEHLAQGAPTMAQFFNTLSHWDMAAMRPREPKRLHLLIEAFRRAWYHRGLYNGDDTQVSGPWAGLASSGFAAAIARAIDSQRQTPVDKAIDPYAHETRAAAGTAAVGAPAGGAEGTTHISAADAEGCMVALTETVVGNYGCLVTSETGVLLNNGMIAFAPIPGQPNSIAPGKRPATNMSPLLVFDSRGAPLLTLGASGGRKIMPAVAQILNLVLDHGLGIQEAVAHPRFDLEGDKVLIDSRFGGDVAERLRAMGHAVEMRAEDLSTFEFGNACGILRAPGGELRAGVNPFQMTFAAGLDG